MSRVVRVSALIGLPVAGEGKEEGSFILRETTVRDHTRQPFTLDRVYNLEAVRAAGTRRYSSARPTSPKSRGNNVVARPIVATRRTSNAV